MDLDDIKGGDDFSMVIERKLDVSDALLAVIGPHWLSVTEPNGGRRLDNASDFVRVEIGKALERGIRVIPVLVGGATLPRPATCQSNLKALCERQAMEVRDSHFHADVKELTDVLHRTLHGTGFVSTGGEPKAIHSCVSGWSSRRDRHLAGCWSRGRVGDRTPSLPARNKLHRIRDLHRRPPRRRQAERVPPRNLSPTLPGNGKQP